MKKISLLCISVAFMTACTWVKPTPQGKNVAVTGPSSTRTCTLLREVSVSVTSKVWFYKRNEDKVASELVTLARNEAANISGDTIIATTAVQDGHQTFKVFNCSK